MSIRFTEDHEWVRVDGDEATVGISDYAQNALGDVVFVELPSEGAEIKKGDEAAVVESVKAASEVYAPVTGTITATNGKLDEEPELVNASPMDDGWFFKMTLADKGELDELMDEDAYEKYVADLD